MNDIAKVDHAEPARNARGRPGGDRQAGGAGGKAPPPMVALTAAAEAFDRALHATIGTLTGGLSPAGLAGAAMDWAVHLAAAPGKRMVLAEQARQDLLRLI